MLKHLKMMFLALLCLLFTGIAMAETYYKIQVTSTDPYRWKYVVSSPQPVLIGNNQSLVTNGMPPPVVQYYVRKKLPLINVYRYVKASPNPLIPAENQTIVPNQSALDTQQGFANQTPPPGTPTPPPTTPQPVDPGIPTLVQNTSAPPKIAVGCRGDQEICNLPATGLTNPARFTVWFGNASKWHKKTWQSGNVPCNSSNFGGSPTSSYKRCFYVDQYYLDRTLLDNAGQNLAPTVNLSLVPPAEIGESTALLKSAAIPPTNSLPYAGAFRISCGYAFGSNDDPIVFPGVPNATHHHTFFGNTAVTAFSTNESLRASGNSTCAGGILNRSGYWIPSLIKTSNGAPQKPEVIVVYYKGIDDYTGNKHTVPPAGLRMIAGKARPLSISESSGDYYCQDNRYVSDASRNYGILWEGNHLQACGGPNETLRMVVSFPQCWDGVNLDSPDHQSHMAYSCGQECENAQGNVVNTGNSCPASHPIAIPNITVNADYSDLDKSATYRLSSDNYPTSQPGGYSLHGDWMNGWDQSIIGRVVKNCLNELRDCGGPNLGDGQTLDGLNVP